jgi:hypothetical protein
MTSRLSIVCRQKRTTNGRKEPAWFVLLVYLYLRKIGKASSQLVAFIVAAEGAEQNVVNVLPSVNIKISPMTPADPNFFDKTKKEKQRVKLEREKTI